MTGSVGRVVRTSLRISSPPFPARGQDQVQQDQIDIGAKSGLQAIGDGAGFNGPVPRIAQGIGDSLPNGGVIFNEENSLVGHAMKDCTMNRSGGGNANVTK